MPRYHYGIPVDKLLNSHKFVNRSAGDDACWPWTPRTDRFGRPFFIVNTSAGKAFLHAKQAVFEAMEGHNIPPESWLTHMVMPDRSTPLRTCCNPSHYSVSLPDGPRLTEVREGLGEIFANIPHRIQPCKLEKKLEAVDRQPAVVAVNMLRKGESLSDIAEASGMDFKEIKRLALGIRWDWQANNVE